MTQDEVIEMARDSGMELYGLGKDRARFVHYLVAFANLVAKHTLMNIDPSKFMSHQEVMEAARMAEREACAKVCDEEGLLWGRRYAAAIRARGQA